LTGGGWKRSAGQGRSESCPGETPGRGAETYRRAAPPRQPPTLLRLADSERTFGSLDGWLRRRLRQVRWKEWKTTAAKRHNLRIRGISESSARKWGGSSKGCWRVAGSRVLQVSLPNSYWNRLGLKTLSQTWQRLNPTA
jgi:Group II intron, maturase-specific domain